MRFSMLTKLGHDHYKNPRSITKKNNRRSKHTCFQWWQGFVSNDGCLLDAQPFPFWSWELFLFLFPHPTSLLSNLSQAYHGSSSAIINEGRPKPLKAFSNKRLALLGRSRWCWLKVCIGSCFMLWLKSYNVQNMQMILFALAHLLPSFLSVLRLVFSIYIYVWTYSIFVEFSIKRGTHQVQLTSTGLSNHSRHWSKPKMRCCKGSVSKISFRKLDCEQIITLFIGLW